MWFNIIMEKIASADLEEREYAFDKYKEIKKINSDLLSDNEWKILHKIMPNNRHDLVENKRRKRRKKDDSFRRKLEAFAKLPDEEKRKFIEDIRKILDND